MLLVSKKTELGDLYQTASLILDVFQGQKTEHLLQVLKYNNIYTQYNQSNMRKYYQPFDLTTNKWVKEYMEYKFAGWYSDQIRKELDKMYINWRYQGKTSTR